jgi:hypothetical protein
VYGDSATQTEAACQTISTRADLAATFFFAAQATFALILSLTFRHGTVKNQTTAAGSGGALPARLSRLTFP